MWFKKNWGYVLAGLALLVTSVIVIRKRSSKNVDFDFDFGNIGSLLGALTNRVSDANPQAQKGAGLYLQLPLTTIINNNKARSLNLKDANLEINYGGERIMKSSSDSAGLTAKVDAKTSQPVTSNMDVLINGKTLAFVKALIAGENPKIDYKVKTKDFFLENSKIVSLK